MIDQKKIDWTYWILFHILAWAIYAGIYINDLSHRNMPDDYWLYIILITFIGSVLCLILKIVYAHFRYHSLPIKLIISIFLCIIVSIIWNVIKSTVHNEMYDGILDDSVYLSYQKIKHLLTPMLMWSALYLVYDYHKLVHENRIQTLKAQALAHENQLKLLSYQLNPHFLFNVLNSIGSMVLKYDDMPLYNTITKLSDFLRYTLESQPWKKVKLKQEIKCTQQYLDIQQVRFKDRLSIEYNIPVQLYEIKLPSLILLPLVENVIKHTIAKSSKHVHLSCTMTKNETDLIIVIENSLDPDMYQKEINSGIGINNVKQRLNAYYSDKASIQIYHNKDKYTVEMSIPISHNREFPS